MKGGAITSIALGSCFLLISSAAFAQEVATPPEGYEAEVLLSFDLDGVSFERQLGGLAYSPDGDPIVYENGELRVETAEGPSILATFDPPLFGDFIALTPDGLSVYFGESTQGDIFSVALDGSGVTLVGNIPNNFDLAFAPEGAPPSIRGQAFVSAPGASGNSIYRLERGGTVSGDEVVTNIPVHSGPLVFDDEANLYYVTSRFDDARQLVRFTPAQLEEGLAAAPIDFGEAEVLLSDIEGAFDMTWYDGKLYLSNLGFTFGRGAIEVVDTRANFLHSVFATFPLGESTARPTFLGFHPGEESFSPGEGAGGGRLLVAYSDYSTLTEVAEIVPELHFIRGDTNRSDEVDMSDAVYLLQYLFLGGSPPEPLASADVNADEGIDLSDAVYILDFLFRGGPMIPAPYPAPGPEPERD